MKHNVLILCGDSFDEVAAVTFAAGLRTVGIRVQLVSTGGTFQRGRNGITIQCDMSMGDALSSDSSIGAVVLIPAATSPIADPRMELLLRRAVAEDALLIGPPRLMHVAEKAAPGGMRDERFVSYHNGRSVPEVTEELIRLLL